MKLLHQGLLSEYAMVYSAADKGNNSLVQVVSLKNQPTADDIKKMLKQVI